VRRYDPALLDRPLSRRGGGWRSPGGCPGHRLGCPSGEHPWYLEESGLQVGIWSRSERLFAWQRWTYRVVAHRRSLTGMRGRLDPFSRDTLDLFGVRKDSSQLAREEI